METRTIQLESQYPTPLNLKLRENQNLGPFTVELRELEPGKRYRLTVTTKPPLPVNLNSATVLVETGLEQVPTVPIYLSANVPAPVMAVPGRLNVPAGATHPTEQVLQINCRGTPPVQVTDVKCNVDAVKWEMLPAEPPAAESKTRTYRLRVTLPPYEELPAGGATLQIFTSAAEQQYKQLDVPIVRMRAPAPPRATSAPQRPSVPTGKKAG